MTYESICLMYSSNQCGETILLHRARGLIDAIHANRHSWLIKKGSVGGYASCEIMQILETTMMSLETFIQERHNNYQEYCKG